MAFVSHATGAAPARGVAASAAPAAAHASSAGGAASPRVLPPYATVDPWAMSGDAPATAQCLRTRARARSRAPRLRAKHASRALTQHPFRAVAGAWQPPGAATDTIPDPLRGTPFLRVPRVTREELGPWVASAASCPRAGLHNPFHQPERYRLYGDICARAAGELRRPEAFAFFAHLIQRVMPKSDAQCAGEVAVTRTFLDNFAGDGVRFAAAGALSVPGDHTGQSSAGYRFPFGAVAVVTPFNFPLEIPALQLLGALFMGNRPLLKPDSKARAAAV